MEVEGVSRSEEIARYLSLSSLLSSQMRWYPFRMEMRMPKWYMDGKGPERLMKLEMLEMLERFEWSMEMKPLWPEGRLSFFPRSGISASGPPASSAGCPDYRGHALLFFPGKWRCLWCLAAPSGIAWSVSGSACSGCRSGIAQVAHALDVDQVSHGLCQVARALDVGQVVHGLCLGCIA